MKRKPLPIRSPARTVAILIGDEHALRPARQRHDPDVRSFLIRGQIHIDCANSTHLPSGEGTGSPTRFSFIMSSKVKGCLA
jgi:hypothetical protein